MKNKKAKKQNKNNEEIIDIKELKKSIEKQQKSIIKLEDKVTKFTSLVKISAALSSTHELKRVLDIIMTESRVVTGAEASSLLLVDHEANELEFYIAQGEKGDAVKDIRLKMGQGIAGWVAESGESVLVKDAATDERFFKGADEKTQFKTESLMAVALKGRRGITGVVEVLNKKGGGPFSKDDLKIFEAFAVQAGIAIENARLYEMAITDGMTGLYIKRFFYYRLNEEIARAKRYKKHLALLIIDIDHFKKVNDTYGHQAGDKTIIALAKVLMEIARKVDIPCRYGGEELAIIAPETDKNGVMHLGERIRERVEEMTVISDGEEIKITVSVGCAVFSLTKITSIEDFIEMADLALYYGKENGRNAVTYYDPKKMKKID